MSISCFLRYLFALKLYYSDKSPRLIEQLRYITEGYHKKITVYIMDTDAIFEPIQEFLG